MGGNAAANSMVLSSSEACDKTPRHAQNAMAATTTAPASHRRG
jgi:hypothetical protein